MILFENSIIKLDYNPATDILVVKHPDLHGYLVPEIKYSISILMETVRNYDIRKVLLDSSDTVVSASPEESREVSLSLAAGFMQTRIMKLARVQSQSESVETLAEGNIANIQQTYSLPFLLQNFPTKEEALVWLQE